MADTKEMVRAVSVYTAQSNTPETDAQEFVPHTVELSDGTKTTVRARDPMDAIERVNRSLRR